ncbi:MAG TPA: cyanophycin synthetase, partial [Coriobacteriia bacterium]|nr:cyanophycin synthetase [Coriobacteriia bacterium]
GPGTAGVEQIFLERAKLSHTHPRAVRPEGALSPVDEQLTVRFLVTGRPHAPGGLTTVSVRGVHGSYPSLSLSAPSYQATNVATAIAAAEAALGRGLDAERARRSLIDARLPGRFELMLDEPPVVVDGSHNPQAAYVLAEAIAEAWPAPERRPLVVLGVLSDKDAKGIVQALAPVVSGFAVCAPVSARALPAQVLADIVEVVTGVRPWVFDTVAAALLALTVESAGKEGLVVTGSLTTAGEARHFLRDRKATDRR